MALAHLTLCQLTHIHSPRSFDIMGQSIHRSIMKLAQKQLKYNIPFKAPPVLACMKNTALGGVSQDKYSLWLFFVLYLSLDMPPHAVFSIHTRGSALSNMHTYLVGN